MREEDDKSSLPLREIRDIFITCLYSAIFSHIRKMSIWNDVLADISKIVVYRKQLISSSVHEKKFSQDLLIMNRN